MQLDTIFTRGAVRHLGGPRFFERGATYAASGRVKKLKMGEEEVTATVQGQRTYRVRLWIEVGGPAHSCTCPVGEEGLFCKHCVAVGLAFAGRDNEPSTTDAADDARAIDIGSYLHSQPKDALVDLLLQQAGEDEFLRGRLLLDATKKGGADVDLDGFRVAIESMINVGEFVDYRGMYSYSNGIEQVIDSVGALLKEGHAAEVVELCEHALTCLEDALGRVDDSDGYMGGIKDRLCELHHKACVRARPDPAALAERLFEWELHSEWETFYRAAETYADVLGDEGLVVFRRLAEEVWAKVPEITSRDESDRSHAGFRFNITHMMEALARVTGDVDALVAVKSKDLSHAYHYVEIVELYRDAGRFDRALEWAQKGLAAFPKGTDLRLLEVLADEYHRRGRRDDVLDLMWTAFAEAPDPASFERLGRHATRTGSWDEWRPKALDLIIRTDIARRKGERQPRNRWARPAGSSDLVEVFLSEGDIEAAWAEAQAGGCSDGLWMRLAALREADHPADAFPLYQDEVERTIGKKNNPAYAEAVELMGKVKGLMERAGRGDEFPAYLESVKASHKPKRNFIKLVGQTKL